MGNAFVKGIFWSTVINIGMIASTRERGGDQPPVRNIGNFTVNYVTNQTQSFSPPHSNTRGGFRGERGGHQPPVQNIGNFTVNYVTDQTRSSSLPHSNTRGGFWGEHGGHWTTARIGNFMVNHFMNQTRSSPSPHLNTRGVRSFGRQIDRNTHRHQSTTHRSSGQRPVNEVVVSDGFISMNICNNVNICPESDDSQEQSHLSSDHAAHSTVDVSPSSLSGLDEEITSTPHHLHSPSSTASQHTSQSHAVHSTDRVSPSSATQLDPSRTTTPSHMRRADPTILQSPVHSDSSNRMNHRVSVSEDRSFAPHGHEELRRHIQQLPPALNSTSPKSDNAHNDQSHGPQDQARPTEDHNVNVELSLAPPNQAMDPSFLNPGQKKPGFNSAFDSETRPTTRPVTSDNVKVAADFNEQTDERPSPKRRKATHRLQSDSAPSSHPENLININDSPTVSDDE